MVDISSLYTAISKVCPIDGVSGDGTIWFKGSANTSQRAAANTILTNWVDPIITSGVDVERDARLESGFTFNTKSYQTDDKSIINILGAAQMAALAIQAGAQPGNLRWFSSDFDFYWIPTDNSQVTMDAQTVVAFGMSAGAFRSGIIYAARAIKNDLLNGVPVNLKTDPRWPV